MPPPRAAADEEGEVMDKIEMMNPKFNKGDWGPGAWLNEPDKVQWIDETTGLDCLIVRNNGGALCGYVGVLPGHPWHGKGYSDIDCELADVHGGLTVANKCHEREDGLGICHVPQNGRPADVWWLGFDCAHCGDQSPAYERTWDGGTYRDVRYVTRECANLARQIAAAHP